VQAPCSLTRAGRARSARAAGRAGLAVHPEHQETPGDAECAGQERSREADVEYMGDSPIEHRVSFLLQADAANKCYRVLRQRLPAAVLQKS